MSVTDGSHPPAVDPKFELALLVAMTRLSDEPGRCLAFLEVAATRNPVHDPRAIARGAWQMSAVLSRVPRSWLPGCFGLRLGSGVGVVHQRSAPRLLAASEAPATAEMSEPGPLHSISAADPRDHREGSSPPGRRTTLHRPRRERHEFVSATVTPGSARSVGRQSRRGRRRCRSAEGRQATARCPCGE
jgi:hypothetical protein